MSDQKSWFESGNPKLMFVFGFVTGVALISLLTSGALVSQVGGTTEVKKANTAVVAANTNTAPAAPTAPVVAEDVPEVTNKDHIRGGKDAKVVMIEYSDFQCPYCSRHHPTMLKLMDTYGDKIQWVYRHFPLSFHANAQPAAVASECAGEQGKFWEFADAMFVGQTSLSGAAATAEAFYTSTAKELGLDIGKFESCLDSGKYDDLISEQETTGGAAGVSGTPATFVNGQLVSGAVPYATLQKMIDAELAK